MPVKSETGSPVRKFAAIAVAEFETLTAFTTLLEQERAALTDSDNDALPGIAAAKPDLTQTLRRCAEERVGVLNDAGIAINSGAVRAFLAQDAQAAKTWENVLTLARIASEINAANGFVVQQRLTRVSNALALLAGSKSSLYDTSGTAAHGIRASRSLGSV